MIKEADLVPGKVITKLNQTWTNAGLDATVEAWMVIGFTTQVKRRHNKSKAPREGWHVLLLKFGEGRVLWDVVISPSEMMTNNWKRLF